jgi:ATP adenylyltransferase
MNQVWAPWRIDYILGPKDDGCFLCTMFAATDDRSFRLLHRGVSCAVLMNRYPYTGGHLMVAPYRHVEGLCDLTAEERSELMELTNRSVEIVKLVMKPQAFNVGLNLGAAAGAGLKDHVHMHIVPRWVGDTNFMPVLGNTSVIPQALDELYDLLKPHFT